MQVKSKKRVKKKSTKTRPYNFNHYIGRNLEILYDFYH